MTQFDEAAASSEFQRDPSLQAEFGTLDVYTAYARGVASGRIIPPVCGRTVTAEAQPRREADEPVSPPVQRFASSAAPKRQRQALASRDAAKRQAVAPDLRGIWQAHGPKAGRVQCSTLMQRFGSFEEFEQHVANHSPEAVTNAR